MTAANSYIRALTAARHLAENSKFLDTLDSGRVLLTFPNVPHLIVAVDPAATLDEIAEAVLEQATIENLKARAAMHQMPAGGPKQ